MYLFPVLIGKSSCKDLGCHSKIYVRLEENIQYINEVLENFKKLEYYISNND